MKIGEEKNPLLGLAQDLHPLDNAHTERTKKRSSKSFDSEDLK